VSVVGIAAVGVLLMASCGGSHASTDLSIRIQSGFGRFAENKQFTLRCDPVGGDMPNREALCRLLAAHRNLMLFRSDQLSTCLGGLGIPPTISLSGTAAGEKVNAQVRLCDMPGGAAGNAYWAAVDAPGKFSLAAARVRYCDDPSLKRVPLDSKLLRRCVYGNA
jgi:hypothetical protein